MVFKKALQQMLDQVYEAAQGDVRTSPVFREGEFGGRPPGQRPTVFPPQPEGTSPETFGAPETIYPRQQVSEGPSRTGPAPESTVGDSATRPRPVRTVAREERASTSSVAPVAVRRSRPAGHATPDAHLHRANVLNALQSGPGLRTALVLAEIVGPPRSIRGMDDLGR